MFIVLLQVNLRPLSLITTQREVDNWVSQTSFMSAATYTRVSRIGPQHHRRDCSRLLAGVSFPCVPRVRLDRLSDSLKNCHRLRTSRRNLRIRSSRIR